MLYIKTGHHILIPLLAIFLFAGICEAADDGFNSAKKIEGKNTIVYLYPDADINGLIQELNIRPSEKMAAGKILKPTNSADEELSDMLDTLYAQVSDIMDMHIYNLTVNIKICRDQGQLGIIHKDLFNTDLANKSSFYVYNLDTIYISSNSFKKEIIGHEMAHAIMSHYFAVPPPQKMQELFAMYVEYNLRKIK